MDVYSRYIQIKMHLKDDELTTFCLPKRVYCYKVMHFSLKTIGVHTTRDDSNFQEILGNIVEYYIDDLVVNTWQRKDHLEHIQAVFE